MTYFGLSAFLSNIPRENTCFVGRTVACLIDDIYHPARGVINIIYQPAPTPHPPTPAPQAGDCAHTNRLLRKCAKDH